MPKGAVNMAKMLEASRLRFVQLLVPEDHAFCCEVHKGIFFDMQKKATNGTYSEKMRDYALAIFKGLDTCRTKQEVTVQCVHYDLINKKEGRKILRDKDGNPLKTPKRCDVEITGTRAFLAECKSLCPKHRTK